MVILLSNLSKERFNIENGTYAIIEKAGGSVNKLDPYFQQNTTEPAH